MADIDNNGDGELDLLLASFGVTSPLTMQEVRYLLYNETKAASTANIELDPLRRISSEAEFNMMMYMLLRERGYKVERERVEGMIDRRPDLVLTREGVEGYENTEIVLELKYLDSNFAAAEKTDVQKFKDESKSTEKVPMIVWFNRYKLATVHASTEPWNISMIKAGKKKGAKGTETVHQKITETERDNGVAWLKTAKTLAQVKGSRAIVIVLIGTNIYSFEPQLPEVDDPNAHDG